jgi:Protein of unknown function (DUF2851).
MTEAFLSFLWKYRLYNPECLAIAGDKIEVVHPGELNLHSGPDFFNTQIKIGETLWAGNLEVHVKASDWNLHNHDKNAAFDNVVLHITADNDQPVYTSKGREVPTLALEFPVIFLTSYQNLYKCTRQIPCSESIAAVDGFTTAAWLSKLGIERLEAKISQIDQNMESTINDWEESFYWQLARSFGFHVNAQLFEALAKSVPFSIVRKHSHNLQQMEALFYGQAGFLKDDYSNDEYYNSLRKEYCFFRSKYNLSPIEPHLWKFMRLRPGNFPTIRIAQFVSLMYKETSLFSNILEANDLKLLQQLLQAALSEYWETHYTFGNVSKPSKKTMGLKSVNVLIINTIVPFYFLYGKKLAQEKYQDKAVQMLEELEAEENVIIREWKHYGIKPGNAFDSQALLHLKSEYCDKRRCLECGIGLKIITKQ